MKISNLKKIFENTKLPGYEAHKEMLPKARGYKNILGFMQSAVNIILFNNNERLNFILTKRSQNLPHHPGQISLPGGAYDLQDHNLWETAKRETYEEIGIRLKDENYICELTPIPVDVSRFVVFPFVSYIDFIPNIKINTDEVEKVYFVDIETFFLPENIKNFSYTKNKQIFEYKYFQLENEQVWGLTAMILNELNHILKAEFNEE